MKMTGFRLDGWVRIWAMSPIKKMDESLGIDPRRGVRRGIADCVGSLAKASTMTGRRSSCLSTARALGAVP